MTTEYFWNHEYRKNSPTGTATAIDGAETVLRAAVYQSLSTTSDINANAHLMFRVIDAAKEREVDLLLFPELFLGGYDVPHSKHRAFGVHKNGPTMKAIGQTVKKMGVAVAFGYSESDDVEENSFYYENHNPQENDHPVGKESSADEDDVDQQLEKENCTKPIYNSVIVFDVDGSVVFNYRKTHLWQDNERKRFNCGTASDLTVFSIKKAPHLKIGIVVCYDIEFPEPARILAIQGCTLLLVPTALAGCEISAAIPMQMVPTRALENHLWLLYSNFVGEHNRKKSPTKFCGLSAIIAPDGECVGRASRASAALLITDITRTDEYISSFHDTPYILDRRPDLYGKLLESPTYEYEQPTHKTAKARRTADLQKRLQAESDGKLIHIQDFSRNYQREE